LSEIEEVRYRRPTSAAIEEYLLERSAENAIKGYIAEEAQARKHGHSLATQRRWRRRRYGPKAVQFGRDWLYAEDATERWLDEQLAKVEAERKTHARRLGKGAA
jgi:hypothetical protein